MKRLINGLDKNLGPYLVTLFVGILFSGLSVLGPTISGTMISAFIDNTGSGLHYLILYLLIGLLQIVFCLLDSYAGKRFTIRQKSMMRCFAFRAFSKKDSAGKEKINTFSSFINNDIPTLVEQYFSGTIDIVKCVFLLGLSAISMLSVHVVLALIVFVASLLIVMCPAATRKRGGKARKAYSEALGKYNIGLQSLLEGLRVVTSYGYYSRANEIQEQHNKAVAEKEQRLIKSQMAILTMSSFLQIGKTITILIVGAILISKGQMNIGGLLVVVQLAEMIAAPAEVLAYMIHAKNEAEPLLDKYKEIICDETLNNDSAETVINKIECITVNNISYSADEIEILKNVSVKFEAGKNYLISGESGSGKSTLMRLISRIGDQEYSGQITCNGINIKQLSKNNYYEKICPVFQETYLFYTTLEENILLGRDIPKDIFKDVIKKLNLQYLLERYNGMDITPEILEQISGGERQRVALARAMVGKHEVYLLDEITSALDSSNSEMVEEALLTENAMVIHVCHKPNLRLQQYYDGKYKMNNGKMEACT